MVGLARRGIAGRRRRGDPWLSLARALPRTARGRIGRPGGRQGDLPGGRRLWPGRRPGLSSRRPPVLACVCHPWCTSVRWGPGPGLPGPVRMAAWCGAARAGCLRLRGRLGMGPAIQGSATPSLASGWCWASARLAKSVRWPSPKVTGLPGPLRRHSRADRLIHG